MRNYLQDFVHIRKEMKQSGVKGMRWGVRRSSSQLRSAAKARGDAPKKPEAAAAPKESSSGGAVKKAGNIQDNVESSPARYARLTAEAKAGGASQMSEADLKFYNARTQALSQINKLNEEQPSWLRETATKVIQQSAQRQMQGIADAVADKYIGDPLKNALKGAAATAETVKTTSTPAPKPTFALPARKTAESPAPAAKTVKPEAPATKPEATKSSPTKMSFNDALQFYKDNPSETPRNLEGYSPAAQRILLDEIEDFRKRTK